MLGQRNIVPVRSLWIVLELFRTALVPLIIKLDPRISVSLNTNLLKSSSDSPFDLVSS
jgi:hypothetical protein